MFVWNEPSKSRVTAESHAKSREAMFRRELESRAGLLLRLGHKPDDIKARLAANVEWDFDLSKRPSFIGEVDKIVDAVIRRQTVVPQP